jgi:hypothetical protein
MRTNRFSRSIDFLSKHEFIQCFFNQCDRSIDYLTIELSNELSMCCETMNQLIDCQSIAFLSLPSSFQTCPCVFHHNPFDTGRLSCNQFQLQFVKFTFQTCCSRHRKQPLFKSLSLSLSLSFYHLVCACAEPS